MNENNQANILDKPLHADSFSATQLLLPRLIELCDDLLSFLLIKIKNGPFSRLRFEHLHPSTSVLCSSYLEPLDRFLAGRAEDAVVEVADGGGSAGQDRERRGGTHPRHGVGHCGEITPLIDSLAIVGKVLVIAQVCQRERHKSVEQRTEGGSKRRDFFF